MLFNLASLALLCASAVATPRGAPGCGINETVITAGMGAKAELGYSLSVTPAGNNNWNIEVINSANRLDYQGILIYVNQVLNPKAHLGSLTFKNATKWKYQPDALCTAKGIKQSTLQSTVTHAVSDRVLLSKKVTFVWTATPEELAIEGLVVNAVVASLDPGTAGKAKWQRLAFIGIPATAAVGAGGASASAGTAVTSAGAASASAALPAATATGTTGTGSAPAAGATQTIMVGSGGLVYDKPAITANVGDTIVWMFGASPHTVTQSGDAQSCSPMTGGFDSGKMSGPAQYTQVMNTTGKIWYMCTVGTHCASGMKGLITVSAAGSPATNGATDPTTATGAPKAAGAVREGMSTMVLISAVAGLLFAMM